MKYESAAAIDIARVSRAQIAEAYVVTSPIKRMLDVIGASALLLMALPLMVVIAAIIFVFDGSPILFRHSRIGRNGRVFKCLKFRTMVENPDEYLARYLDANPEALAEWTVTRKLKSDPRIIPVIGKFLRKTSLDELPQIFNIFKGDMSLVGPRPVTREELELYGTSSDYYLLARPGLTGQWQISGRNEVTFDERVELDRRYVCSGSMLMDIKIILKTPFAVLAQRGAY